MLSSLLTTYTLRHATYNSLQNFLNMKPEYATIVNKIIQTAESIWLKSWHGQHQEDVVDIAWEWFWENKPLRIAQAQIQTYHYT